MALALTDKRLLVAAPDVGLDPGGDADVQSLEQIP